MPARIRPEVGKPIFNAVILLDCRFGRSFCTACFIVDLTLGAQQHFYCPTASRQVPTRLLVKFEDAAISLRGLWKDPLPSLLIVEVTGHWATQKLPFPFD